MFVEVEKMKNLLLEKKNEIEAARKDRDSR